MIELTKTRRLTFASAVFIIILVIGFITFRTPEYVYKLTPEETIIEMFNPENEYNPDELMKLMAQGDSSNVLIDLRNAYEYNRGTIGNAINIPVSDILDKDVISMFDNLQNDNSSIILFAINEREAYAPWMILRQLGYTNMKVLMGGYSYIAKVAVSYDDTIASSNYIAEKPVMNFGEFIENSSADQPKKIEQIQPAIELPVTPKKRAAAAGGC